MVDIIVAQWKSIGKEATLSMCDNGHIIAAKPGQEFEFETIDDLLKALQNNETKDNVLCERNGITLELVDDGIFYIYNEVTESGIFLSLDDLWDMVYETRFNENNDPTKEDQNEELHIYIHKDRKSGPVCLHIGSERS